MKYYAIIAATSILLLVSCKRDARVCGRTGLAGISGTKLVSKHESFTSPTGFKYEGTSFYNFSGNMLKDTRTPGSPSEPGYDFSYDACDNNLVSAVYGYTNGDGKYVADEKIDYTYEGNTVNTVFSYDDGVGFRPSQQIKAVYTHNKIDLYSTDLDRPSTPFHEELLYNDEGDLIERIWNGSTHFVYTPHPTIINPYSCRPNYPGPAKPSKHIAILEKGYVDGKHVSTGYYSVAATTDDGYLAHSVHILKEHFTSDTAITTTISTFGYKK